MASKSNMVWLMALLVALVNLTGALAKVDCNCHIGVRYSSTKLVNYGKVDSYRRLSSGKQRKCSSSCASKCAADLTNGQKICDAIGSDYNNSGKNIGCFSVVGRTDTRNNKWDFDGVASINGCERSCKCPKGWYDRNRKSCVTGVGCDNIPGLPNGDIGNGFFAWGGTLFRDISGAHSCTVKAV